MNDWLDATLKARLVVDDGFADRVIAINRAQERTRLLLRLVLGLLTCGAMAGFLGVLTAQTYEVFGRKNLLDMLATPAIAEEDFVRDWQRLAEHPALQRHASGQGVDLDLSNFGSRGHPCSRRPIAEDCDTGFLVGMRRFTLLKEPEFSAGSLYRGVKLHLRRAATVDGASFAAAVDDARALARLLLHNTPYSSLLFVGVNEEIERARERGQDTGGARTLFSEKDTLRLAELWEQALALDAVGASPTTRAMIAESKSVIACGARMGAHRGSAFLMTFAEDDAHRAALRLLAEDLDGCIGIAGVEQPGLCKGIQSDWCNAYRSTIELPGIRRVFGALIAAEARIKAAKYSRKMSQFWEREME